MKFLVFHKIYVSEVDTLGTEISESLLCFNFVFSWLKFCILYKNFSRK